MKYYRDVLCPLMESGDVTKVELQKSYELQPKFTHDGKIVRPIVYVADFYIEYKNGTIAIVDTKGYSTPNAQLKRKMFWYHYPDIDYRWIGYSKIDGGFVPFEYIKSQRSLRRKAKKEKKDNLNNG